MGQHLLGRPLEMDGDPPIGFGTFIELGPEDIPTGLLRQLLGRGVADPLEQERVGRAIAGLDRMLVPQRLELDPVVGDDRRELLDGQ